MQTPPEIMDLGFTISSQFHKTTSVAANEEVPPTHNKTSPMANEEHSPTRNKADCESKKGTTRGKEQEEEKQVAIPKRRTFSLRTTLETSAKLRKIA